MNPHYKAPQHRTDFLEWLICAAVATVLTLAVVALFVKLAHAAPPGPDDPQWQALKEHGAWFRSLQSPLGGSCCGPDEDCRAVDWRMSADGTSYEAYMKSTVFLNFPNPGWQRVPSAVVSPRANPTGYAIACWGWKFAANPNRGWLCFIPTSGV